MLESRIYLTGMINNTTWFSRSRVYPIYGDDVSMRRERPDDERYFRDTMNGTFTFTGDVYSSIRQGGVDAEWKMEVMIYDTITAQEAKFGEVRFNKVDCKWDDDDKNVEITFETKDRYTELLAKIDDTYNLVNLAPEIEPITVIKRAILQLYFVGDNRITNIVGNMSYEITSNEESDPDTLEDDYYFYPIATLDYSLNFDLRDSARIDLISGLRAYLEDTYVPDWAETGHPPVGQTFYYESSNGRRVKATPSGSRWICTFVDAQGQTIPFTYLGDSVSIQWAVRDFTPAKVSSEIALSYRGTIFTIAIAVNMRLSLYARILFDVTDGTELNPLWHKRPSEDICSSNLNYRYVLEGDYQGFPLAVKVGTEESDTPTKWGLNSNMKYYVQPEQSRVGDLTHVVPIAWEMWAKNSYWFEVDSGINLYLRDFGCPVEIRDAYPLMSAIDVLLSKLNIGITLGDSVFFSEQSNPITNIQQKIFITPITNIKKTYYTQAAQRGDITLRQVFDMLRDVFQCYWYVNNSNQLIIEHISWFKNGGAYGSDSRIVRADLTTMPTPRYSKPWAFDINKYEYNTDGLPRRLEFGWSDEATAPFNGVARNFDVNFLKDNKADTIKVMNFYSDLDYIIGNPDQVTDDCFALISTDLDNNTIITTEDFGTEGEDVYRAYLQNGYLSFAYLFRYWIYDLPYWEFNPIFPLSPSRASGIKRTKVQNNVVFPCNTTILYSEGLIKTEMGYGDIKNIEMNLSSMVATTQLLYDTE